MACYGIADEQQRLLEEQRKQQEELEYQRELAYQEARKREEEMKMKEEEERKAKEEAARILREQQEAEQSVAKLSENTYLYKNYSAAVIIELQAE